MGHLSALRPRLSITTLWAAFVGMMPSDPWQVAGWPSIGRGLSFKCLVFGHEDCIHRAPGRLYLECLECGRETRGWTLDTELRDNRRVNATSATLLIESPDRFARDATTTRRVPSAPSTNHPDDVTIAA